MLQELLVDRMADGEPLHYNLFLIAAMNPFTKDLVNVVDFTGTKHKGLEYLVRPAPESLNRLMLNFGDFAPWQEKQFLEALIAGLPSDQQRTSMSSFIALVLHCQSFLRCAQLDNIKVSIRDISERALKIFNFLNNTPNVRDLLLNMNAKDFAGPLEDVRWWRAVIISLYISYYLRLPANVSLPPTTQTLVERLDWKHQGTIPRIQTWFHRLT